VYGTGWLGVDIAFFAGPAMAPVAAKAAKTPQAKSIDFIAVLLKIGPKRPVR
jgi:hypothetical protein